MAETAVASAPVPDAAATGRPSKTLAAKEPCAVVIFGASGDLTRRKLLPALYNLHREKLLPEHFYVVGFSRTDLNDDSFRVHAKDAVVEFSRTGAPEDGLWNSFAEKMRYLPSHYDSPAAYRALADLLKELNQNGTCPNRIFYLATSPSLYETIIKHLGEAGLSGPLFPGGGWARIVVEKPFGHDVESAQTLNREVTSVFRETDVYRIDHYLGKETVQNLLVFRFANGIFEPIWNRNYVDHVQITVSETLGVGSRGAFYEEAGALRDVVQNHMLQLLCLTAMEPPVSFDERSVRNEKTKVLQAVRPIPPDDVDAFAVRGQYAEGFVAGQKTKGYRQEPGVAPDSGTETYAAMKFLIENWRWAGVPFYLRTGKAMSKRATEIVIQFKKPPHLLFERVRGSIPEPNVLVIRIQPDEAILLRFGAKIPGPAMKIGPVDMDFRYGESFGGQTAEAYERLLLDCLNGDPTLYARGDWVELSWSLLQPVLDNWSSTTPMRFPSYDAGSWGPAEADSLLAADGRVWRRA